MANRKTNIRSSSRKFLFERLCIIFSIGINAVSGALPQLNESYIRESRMGWSCYTSNDFAGSVKHFKAAIAAAPQSLDAKLGCLLPLIGLHRYREAELLAREVLRSYPANYYANLRLAHILRQRGKIAEAEKILQAALEHYPSDVSFLTELAWVRAARGQQQEAKRLFNEVLILDPQNASARQYLDSFIAPKQSGTNALSNTGFTKTEPTPERQVYLNLMTYGLYADYRNTMFKDHAQLAGLYGSLYLGSKHQVETEFDYLSIHYRGFPKFQQLDATVAYANYQIPQVKLRMGIHYVGGDQAPTTDGWAGFLGAHYYVVEKWDAGVDGYISYYANYPNELEVAQITPHIGINLLQGEHHTLRSDLKGYWIHPNQQINTSENLFSVEERLSFIWKQWTFSSFGWYGRQIFALRDDGFALYNLTEEHKGGFGLEAGYLFSKGLGLNLRIRREIFRELGASRNAYGNLYMALINFKF